jgi:hypothetical protein
MELIHEWDMRIVAVIVNSSGKGYPANYRYAIKTGKKVRRLTKDEKSKWIKKEKLTDRIKHLCKTRIEIDYDRNLERLADPDISMEKWIKIDNKTKGNNH